MNRIAEFFTRCTHKAFVAEIRDIMRNRAGLTKLDVHLLCAGYEDATRLWTVRLHLTEREVFICGSECEETCLDLWRGMMPQVKELANERGLTR